MTPNTLSMEGGRNFVKTVEVKAYFHSPKEPRAQASDAINVSINHMEYIQGKEHGALLGTLDLRGRNRKLKQHTLKLQGVHQRYDPNPNTSFLSVDLESL